MSLAVAHAVEGRRVWWVAPTYLMALHTWRAFKRRFASQWAEKSEYDHFIGLSDGGSITVKTADNPDGLRGVGLDFVIVDEAAFIDEEVWHACLRPALSDRNGAALIISTPRGRNWFFHAFQRGLDPLNEDWRSWRYPTSANPRIPPADLAEAASMLPERIYRQEYEAEFLESGGEVFRMVRRAAIAPPDPQLDPRHRYFMGVDFGRYTDFTACVIVDADAKAVVAVDRFSEATWELQRKRIAALARKWQVLTIVAESNAMGEPNIEALRRSGLCVQPFTTTAASKPPLIEGLVASIESGELALLPDDVLIGELESYSFTTTQAGRTIYQALPGRHDDTVMALALAWREASIPPIAFGFVDI
jgi:phage FluMu gp28-like protein